MRTKTYLNDKKGSIVVEAILLSVPFIFIIGMIMELSLVFYMQSLVTARSIVLSRQIQTGKFPLITQANIESFKQKFCQDPKFNFDCNKLSIHYQPLQSRINEVESNQEIDNSQTSFEFVEQGRIAVLSIYYKWDFITPFLGDLSKPKNERNLSISSISFFRIEQYSN